MDIDEEIRKTKEELERLKKEKEERLKTKEEEEEKIEEAEAEELSEEEIDRRIEKLKEEAEKVEVEELLIPPPDLQKKIMEGEIIKAAIIGGKEVSGIAALYKDGTTGLCIKKKEIEKCYKGEEGEQLYNLFLEWAKTIEAKIKEIKS